MPLLAASGPTTGRRLIGAPSLCYGCHMSVSSPSETPQQAFPLASRPVARPSPFASPLRSSTLYAHLLIFPTIIHWTLECRHVCVPTKPYALFVSTSVPYLAQRVLPRCVVYQILFDLPGGVNKWVQPAHNQGADDRPTTTAVSFGRQ
eukprot:398944-Prorocentrum_minimum.AAC.1